MVVSQSAIREAYGVGSPTVTHSEGAGLQGREPAGLREQTCWPQHLFLSPTFLKDASPVLLSIRVGKLEPEPDCIERQRAGIGIPLGTLLASGELLTSCCLLLPLQGTQGSDSLLLTSTLFVYPSALPFLFSLFSKVKVVTILLEIKGVEYTVLSSH